VGKSDDFGSFWVFARDMVRFVGRRRGIRMLLLLTSATLLEGVGLLLLIPLLGLVLGTGTGIGWLDAAMSTVAKIAGGTSRLSQLAPALGLFALLMLVRSLLILRRDVAIARLQASFVNSHRSRIVSLLSSARWPVVARLRHGRITHVLGGEMQALSDSANVFLLTLVSGGLLAVQCLIVLFLSPYLALFILVLIGIAAGAMRPVYRRSRYLGSVMTETSSALVTSTAQFLGGLKLALSQNLQGSFVEKFRSLMAEGSAKRIEFERQRAIAQAGLTAIPAGIAALVILIGIGVLNAKPALIVGFLLVLGRMAGPVSRIQSYLQQIWHALPAYAAVRRLERDLEEAETPVETARAAAPIRPAPIRFESVGYFHREGRETNRQAGLFGIDLTLEPGTFLGVTGPSGAGKTTFADLLVGLYPPDTGRLLIGDEPLAGAKLAEWRRRISYVSQDPFLFHSSIRENLLWARPDASEAQISAALRLAGAEDLVARMNSGVETPAGERGTLMSGGERQRIALARALLREPLLLVLDEATNAIDVAGEERILTTLAAQENRPTIVMIAHRESSLHFCNLIIELREGRLVRVVEPEPLLKKERRAT
jgi:ATP-binding cassette subfamily C protein